jgi:hypothetical protein
MPSTYILKMGLFIGNTGGQQECSSTVKMLVITVERSGKQACCYPKGKSKPILNFFPSDRLNILHFVYISMILMC